jgi:hypothetical protein
MDAEASPREPKRPFVDGVILRAIRRGRLDAARRDLNPASEASSVSAPRQGAVLPSGGLRRSGIRVTLKRGHDSYFVVRPKNGEAPWQG